MSQQRSFPAPATWSTALRGTTVDVQTPPDTALATEIVAAAALAELTHLISTQSQGATRDSLARLVSQIALWCGSAAAALATDPSFGPIIFYERTRMGMGCPSTLFFFDGLPPSVAVVGAFSPLQLPGSVVARPTFTFHLAMMDRAHTIRALESDAASAPASAALGDSVGNLPDVDARVPPAARVFLSRVRSLFAALREHRDPNWFAQCDNRACGRLFMRGVSHSEDGAPTLRPTAQAHSADADDYWESIAPSHQFYRDQARFCCCECAKQWWKQHAALHAPLETLTGDRRALTVRGALKRNGALHDAVARNRALRKRVFNALSRFECNRSAQLLVTRANVDLGVRLLFETTRRCHALRASPQAPTSTVVARVRALYHSHPLTDPIRDVRQHPPRYVRLLLRHAAVLVSRSLPDS